MEYLIKYYYRLFFEQTEKRDEVVVRVKDPITEEKAKEMVYRYHDYLGSAFNPVTFRISKIKEIKGGE